METQAIEKSAGEKKKTGGRPKKMIKRCSVTGVRFTEMEYRKVQRKAKEVGLKLTVYIRQMAIHGKVEANLSPEQMELIRQLAGMANNINQLTKKCHQQGIHGVFMYFEQHGKIIRDI